MKMSRLAVLRSLMINQATKQRQNFLLWNLRYCVRFASGNNGGDRASGQDFDREAYNRRQKRLVAAIIGSSVGLIGSSYGLYRKLTKSKAKAESPHPSIDSRNSSNESDTIANKEEGDEESDGKRKKGKQGFRERRVRKRIK